MIARHFEIKCIPLREEQEALEAAVKRDKAAFMLFAYGVAIGISGTLVVIGAMLK